MTLSYSVLFGFSILIPFTLAQYFCPFFFFYSMFLSFAFRIWLLNKHTHMRTSTHTLTLNAYTLQQVQTCTCNHLVYSFAIAVIYIERDSLTDVVQTYIFACTAFKCKMIHTFLSSDLKVNALNIQSDVSINTQHM